MDRRQLLRGLLAAPFLLKAKPFPRAPLVPTGWFTVGPNGQYPTIKAALDAASSAGGGTVFVCAGHTEWITQDFVFEGTAEAFTSHVGLIGSVVQRPRFSWRKTPKKG